MCSSSLAASHRGHRSATIAYLPSVSARNGGASRRDGGVITQSLLSRATVVSNACMWLGDDGDNRGGECYTSHAAALVRLSWQMKYCMAPIWFASFFEKASVSRTRRETRCRMVLL